MERALPLLHSNLKVSVGSLGSNCAGWKTWPSCPLCQQARWPADSLFPLMLQSVHTESGYVDRHSQEKKTQEIRSLSFFLASCQHGTVTAVLIWQRQEDEVFGPRGCHFLPVPWLVCSSLCSTFFSPLTQQGQGIFSSEVKKLSLRAWVI